MVATGNTALFGKAVILRLVMDFSGAVAAIVGGTRKTFRPEVAFGLLERKDSDCHEHPMLGRLFSSGAHLLCGMPNSVSSG